MQKSQKQSPQEAFGVQDILYILFKHKWKIILLSLMGFGASAFVFVNREVLYQSQANVLVSYVVNRSPADDYQSQAGGPNGPGDAVINTEVEILTSENLAKAVAKEVGVEKILPDAPPGTQPDDVAGIIQGHLEVVVTPGNNVMHISYSNPSRDNAVLVLNEILKQYSVKHLELHRSAAAYDDVYKQTEEVRLRLKQTETELDKLRSESGITTREGAIGALENQRARANEDLMAAKAELAEKAAHIEALEKSPLYSGVGADGLKKDPKETPAGVKVPLQVLSEYKVLLDTLAVLQKRDIEQRMKFKSGNRQVSLTQQQISEAESKRTALVAKYPDLLTQSALLEGDSRSPEMDLFSEKAKLASVTARVEAYKQHLVEIEEEYKEQYAKGSQIEVLERRRQMEDAEYRSLELKLKEAVLDNRLDPTRMPPNLKTIQDPSIPKPTYDKLTKKIVAGLAAAGVALGVGLAFLIELLFNKKIQRPTDIHARLQLPLLLSIPYIKRKERGGLMLGHEESVPRLANGSASNGSAKESLIEHKMTPETAIRKASHFILPYSETIRDRIIFNFAVNNVTHKPKLVAVTGLSEGAGASTIAAGLAKSFSEINGAKVLLVDLSSRNPEDNPMFGEVARYSLTGALQLAKGPQFKRGDQNLYYASASARRDESGLTTFSPMHLYEMMPHLEASDYDYIVFDMPPIDQTSRTLTMAGLMDKVILVLDAENTSKDALKWGYSELGKGKADVSCIFNKARSQAPGWLIGQS